MPTNISNGGNLILVRTQTPIPNEKTILTGKGTIRDPKKGEDKRKDPTLKVDSNNSKMHIAQPAGCSPVATAFVDGQTHPKPVIPDTIAKSLAIGSPADGFYSVEIANKTGGSGTIVPEPEIAEGMKLLAETEGIFTETAGGVVISALKRLARENIIHPDEETVALITGTGLKTLGAIADQVETSTIEPTIGSFDEIVMGTAVT
mgnify:CR=1 FL=1